MQHKAEGRTVQEKRQYCNIYDTLITMELQTLLRRLGLGKRAGDVYRTLLASKEPLLVATLAKKSALARMQVYRSLAELMRAGFVEKVKRGKRTYYRAESPRRVEEAFVTEAGNAGVTTEVYALRREKEAPQSMRFFTGFKGIRAVFDDVIDHAPRGSTVYRYTSERDLDAVNRYLSPTYRTRRDKKKIERLVISHPVSARKKRPRLERFVKFFSSDEEVFDQNVIQLIYGDRIAFINLSTEEAFVMEDARVASFQKAIFTQLYRKL